jgi:phage shock protein E
MPGKDVRTLLQFGWVACLLLVAPLACTATDRDSTRSDGSKLITAEELNQRIQSSQEPLILDVRSEEEYAEGHIPGALNIPHDELPDRLSEIEVAKTDEIVVHCRSGHRAGIAEKVLVDAGFSDVRDLEGHMNGWQSGGYPIERP